MQKRIGLAIVFMVRPCFQKCNHLRNINRQCIKLPA
jgi:hypothetical protein